MASNKRKNQKKKDKDGGEFYENPEVLADQINKAESFLVQNRKIASIAGIVILLALAGLFGYKYYQGNQDQLAQADMFQAVFYFEQDSIDLALDGDGNNYGFRDIVDVYPGTESANLANFYIGVINLKKGNYEVAKLYLADFSSSDLLLQARAYSLIGDAHMELEEYEEAIANYNKAAAYHPNQYFSPTYLRKAALAYEKLEQWDGAIECYQKIVDEFQTSPEYQPARRHLARIEQKAKS